MRPAPRSLALALAATLPLLALVACGDDDGGSGSGSPQTEEGLEERAREFGEAMLAGDSTYEFLTAECREQFSSSEWDAQMQMIISFAESFAEVSFDEMSVGEITIEDFDEDSAMVAMELLDPDGERFDDEGEASEMVYEDGDWRVPDCDAFGFDEDTSGDADTGEATDDTAFEGELRPADEVAEEQKREESADGVLGEAVQVADLDVIVSAITYDAEEDDLLRVEIRVENRTSEDTSTPDVAVVCSDGERGTARFTADEGMYEPYSDLPTGSFEEGTALVRIPEVCPDPLVRVEVFSFDTEAADWELPAG